MSVCVVKSIYCICGHGRTLVDVPVIILIFSTFRLIFRNELSVVKVCNDRWWEFNCIWMCVWGWLCECIWFPIFKCFDSNAWMRLFEDVFVRVLLVGVRESHGVNDCVCVCMRVWVLTWECIFANYVSRWIVWPCNISIIYIYVFSSTHMCWTCSRELADTAILVRLFIYGKSL